jgi:hypothetical protein
MVAAVPDDAASPHEGLFLGALLEQV